MKVKCNNCNTVLNIDDAKITAPSILIACPKCQQKMNVSKPKLSAEIPIVSATISNEESNSGNQRQNFQPANNPVQQGLPRCPHCQMEVHPNTSKCPYCHEEIASFNPQKNALLKIVWWIVGAVVLYFAAKIYDHYQMESTMDEVNKIMNSTK